jgi:hypothetical protein
MTRELDDPETAAAREERPVASPPLPR